MMDTYGNNDMLTADLGLDMSRVQPLEDNEIPILPAGKYRVMVSHAEIRTSKAGNDYINLQYRVTEGDYAGRGVLFDMFAVWSANPEFALRRFRALREACGLNPAVGGNLAELLEKEFVAYVKLRESRRNDAVPGDMENAVSKYLPLEKKQPAIKKAPAPSAPKAALAPAAAPAPSGAPAPAQTATPSEQSVQPWE